jgi:hypothetical protein
MTKARRAITPAAPIISSITVNVPAKGHQPVPHTPKSQRAQASKRARRSRHPSTCLCVYDGATHIGTFCVRDRSDSSYTDTGKLIGMFGTDDEAMAALPLGRRA